MSPTPQPQSEYGQFLSQLVQRVTIAHDKDLLDENALSDVVQELLEGRALTLPMLAQIFGVEVIHDLTKPTPAMQTAANVAFFGQQLYAAALQGLLSHPGPMVTRSGQSVVLDPEAAAEIAFQFARAGLKRALRGDLS